MRSTLSILLLFTAVAAFCSVPQPEYVPLCDSPLALGPLTAGGAASARSVSPAVWNGQSFIVFFNDGATLYYRRFFADGTPADPRIVLASTNLSESVVSAVYTGNGFAIAYEVQSTVYRQVYFMTLDRYCNILSGPTKVSMVGYAEDGSVWAWGINASGELGDGKGGYDYNAELVLNLADAQELSSGSVHSLVIRSDSRVWGWGQNYIGCLGICGTSQAPAPVQVTEGEGYSRVAAGHDHSLGLKTDGTVWGWGCNEAGQLGDGTEYSSSEPVQAIGLEDIIAIAAGEGFSMALQDDGTVWTWGSGNCIGNGTWDNSNVPVHLTTLEGITAISARCYSPLALKSDGTVWAWAGMYYGNSPVQVTGLSNITNVASGASFYLAMSNDGTVWAWGCNFCGQLGDGTNDDSETPVQVSGLSNVTAICAGGDHAMAMKNDGTLWAWGSDGVGQLGNGTAVDSNVPVRVLSVLNPLRISAGADFSTALLPRSSMEVSSAVAEIPLRLVRDDSSSTGYYAYFDCIEHAEGYNIYEGDTASFYSHSGAPGNLCQTGFTDMGGGQLRAEISPSPGDHYYLVTACGAGIEGPSGYDSLGAEISATYSTCEP